MIITFSKKSNMFWTLCFSLTVILICSKFIYAFMFWKLFLLLAYWHWCNFRDSSWKFCQFVNVSYRTFFLLPWNVEISRPANSFFRSIIMKYYLECYLLMLGVGSTAKCWTLHHKMQNITEVKQILVNAEHCQLQQLFCYMCFFLCCLSYFNLVLNWLRPYLSKISVFTRATKKILSDRQSDIPIRCFQFSSGAT